MGRPCWLWGSRKIRIFFLLYRGKFGFWTVVDVFHTVRAVSIVRVHCCVVRLEYISTYSTTV